MTNEPDLPIRDNWMGMYLDGLELPDIKMGDDNSYEQPRDVPSTLASPEETNERQ